MTFLSYTLPITWIGKIICSRHKLSNVLSKVVRNYPILRELLLQRKTLTLRLGMMRILLLWHGRGTPWFLMWVAIVCSFPPLMGFRMSFAKLSTRSKILILAMSWRWKFSQSSNKEWWLWQIIMGFLLVYGPNWINSRIYTWNVAKMPPLWQILLTGIGSLSFSLVWIQTMTLFWFRFWVKRNYLYYLRCFTLFTARKVIGLLCLRTNPLTNLLWLQARQVSQALLYPLQSLPEIVVGVPIARSLGTW